MDDPWIKNPLANLITKLVARKEASSVVQLEPIYIFSNLEYRVRNFWDIHYSHQNKP